MSAIVTEWKCLLNCDLKDKNIMSTVKCFSISKVEYFTFS